MDRTLQNIINSAINEQNKFQDKVTSSFVSNKQECFATFLVRNSGIIAGTDTIVEIYRQINPLLKIEILKEDGYYINKGDAIASVQGKMIDVLKGSNIVINYLQHLSSVATIADKYNEELVNTNCKLVIDNQYTPNCRYFEEVAVQKVGCSLRFETEDNFLITENHLLLSENISNSVESIRKKYPNSIIEIEIKTKDDYLEALKTSVNKISLLNFKDVELKELLEEDHFGIEVGVSGSYPIGKIRSIAKMGADYIIINNLKCMSKGLDVYLKLYKRSIKK